MYLESQSRKSTVILTRLKIPLLKQRFASQAQWVFITRKPIEKQYNRNFSWILGNFNKNLCKTKSQKVVCSNRYDTLYPTDDGDDSHSSRNAETLSSKSTSSNSSTSIKKKKRQHKKREINNSTAREILTEKYNKNHTICKRKQIFQQTQTNQIKNQNSLKISATIVKENSSQQKYDKIRNVKYHNIKEWKMPNRLPSTFCNPVAQKKEVVLSTVSMLKSLHMLNITVTSHNLVPASKEQTLS